MKRLSAHIALLFIMVPVLLYGQQEPMYGQYIFNNTIINPAQAGGYAMNRIGLLARNQWVGVDGAPRTETVYANLRLPGQLGLGIGLYQDRLGPEVNLQLQTDLAYHAKISDKFFLSGGIRLVAAHIRLNLMDVPNVDPGNPFFQENLSSGLMLNAGAGLLLHSGKSYFGLSVPKVFRNQIGISKPGDIDFQKEREYTHVCLCGYQPGSVR
jgi:type IX secretion system PorP/SprF family membrane protein